jgi:hypothetical protein
MSKTPTLNRRQSLDSIPVRNGGFVREARAGGGIDLVIRGPRPKGLLSRFMPETIEQRFKLDELGTAVYDLIDGERTAEQVMNDFAGTYRLNKREAEVSVAAFLRMLAERKIISIVVP